MITLNNLLKKLHIAFSEMQLKFLHPSLYIICLDESFSGKTDDAKLEKVATKIEISPTELQDTVTASGSVLLLLSPSELASDYSFLQTAPTASHWLEYLAGASPRQKKNAGIPVVHFYGYKGGQGRSTILAMLSQSLAEDGYKVLAIDADIEAPSLQSIFDGAATTLESTLLGCTLFDLVHRFRNKCAFGTVCAMI